MESHAEDANPEAARTLGEEVDRRFTSAWGTREPVYAWIAPRQLREPLDGEVVVVDDGGMEPPQDEAVAALAVSALATAVELESTADAGELVQVTIAVSCCSTTAVLRCPDGTVKQSGEAVGTLTKLLHGWGRFSKCRCCHSSEDEAELEQTSELERAGILDSLRMLGATAGLGFGAERSAG